LIAQALHAMLRSQAEFDGKKMVKAAEERMSKSMDKCKENMATLRTGAT
jgi:ribosome recycling factor